MPVKTITNAETVVDGIEEDFDFAVRRESLATLVSPHADGITVRKSVGNDACPSKFIIVAIAC